MKNKQELEQKVEQTLNSLDNLQQLEANEFLHAKILHRMGGNSTATNLGYSKIMIRLAAILCLLIGINCVSFYVLKPQTDIGKVTAAKTATGANAFAEAYGLNNNLNSY